MQTGVDVMSGLLPKKFQTIDIAAAVWILLGLLSLIPLTAWLDVSLPLFTFVWLAIPLFALLKTGRAATIGILQIPWSQFAKNGTINFALLMLVMALFEPWSHTYQSLLNMVFSSSHADLTFVWVTRYPGALGLASMFVFSGAVTLFGEELFFRGWLLQKLLKRMRPVLAIGLQALLFSIPQAIAALFLKPIQSVLYVIVYSWLAIGVIGGWSAWRTNSIWPGLASATLMNLILTMLLR
ncbi:MAG: CPBP family intramembrane glutamic endopeptidase [Chloroflexota bacterium]|jgi:membrane protease YdiL (CAAX protease family)